jgi:hypothetical protein
MTDIPRDPPPPFNPDTRTQNNNYMDPQEKQEILDAINASHDIAFKAYQALFENSIKGFSEQLAQFEERNAGQHKEIIKRQDITNGRVTKLEKETAPFRWCSRNPKAAIVFGVLILTGILTLGIILSVDNLLKILP